jgi:hypothetical protein
VLREKLRQEEAKIPIRINKNPLSFKLISIHLTSGHQQEKNREAKGNTFHLVPGYSAP